VVGFCWGGRGVALLVERVGGRESCWAWAATRSTACSEVRWDDDVEARVVIDLPRWIFSLTFPRVC
jgi:hypothetical protein